MFQTGFPSNIRSSKLRCWTETRLKHVEHLTEINKLRNVASCWLYSAKEIQQDFLAFKDENDEFSRNVRCHLLSGGSLKSRTEDCVSLPEEAISGCKFSCCFKHTTYLDRHRAPQRFINAIRTSFL